MVLIHIRSGETYPISFLPLYPVDLEEQMKDWEESFNWSVYFNHSNIEVYKMVIPRHNEIQGAIALEIKEDHIWIHLLESIPRKRKELDLIGEHLIAFACKRSIELGFEGAVAFQSKKKASLILYYEKIINAIHIGNGLMIINESVAEKLIMLYLS